MARSGEFDGFEGIDEAGEDDEAGDPGGTLSDEAEDGALHEVTGAILRYTRRDDVSGKGHGHVGEHHVNGGDASEPLKRKKESTSASVLSL